MYGREIKQGDNVTFIPLTDESLGIWALFNGTILYSEQDCCDFRTVRGTFHRLINVNVLKRRTRALLGLSRDLSHPTVRRGERVTESLILMDIFSINMAKRVLITIDW